MDPLSTLTPEDRWRSVVLDEVFKGLAHSAELSRMLIFKGARVLRLRLQDFLRASSDIDASVADIATNLGRLDYESLEKIRHLADRSISAYFEDQDPVRYELQQSTIRNRSKTPDPRGWNVYWLEIQVRDLAAEGGIAASAPQLRIDISAPEKLSPRSTSPLVVDGRTINAVTLERIAGEKPRAFLSSLPSYRRKIGKTPKVPRRVSDLYDLVKIARKHPLTDDAFWAIAGGEFTLACQSRLIDCAGLASFHEDWDGTREAYAANKTLPSDVTFGEVEATVGQIVEFLEAHRFIPFAHELTNNPLGDR